MSGHTPYHVEIMVCYWCMAISSAGLGGYSAGMASRGEWPWLICAFYALLTAVSIYLIMDEVRQDKATGGAE